MEPPLPPPPPPVPFGDPTLADRENRAVVGKGILVGCGGCAAVVLAFVMLGVGFFALVLGSIRHSDVCTQAMARASASAEVRALVGIPLKQGWMVSGSVSTAGSSGSADVSFSISGPKGGATLHARARKENGVWIFITLKVTPDSTRRPIDLLAPTQVAQKPGKGLFMGAT